MKREDETPAVDCFVPRRPDRGQGALSTPKYLWDEYISQRRPVVVKGTPADAKTWAVQNWVATDAGHDYLRRRAGRALVSVEYRSSDVEGFGRGQRRTMRFGEFLTRLDGGSEQLYISSAEQTIGPHGFPDLMVSPLTELRRDFPTRLSWAGRLVPAQINLWMGSSTEGASSGLHHDYHDNFYVLLSGRKRFLLYPPSFQPHMQTYGEATVVHPNGRIVYRGQEGINADGSHQDDVDRFYGRDNGNGGASDGDGGHVEVVLPESESGAEPPSFCRVRAEDLDVPPAMKIELHAGESLFLPAGWFHEVTSLNDGGRAHLALNYWLQPPTNLQRGSAGFEQPYMSSFWPDVFASGLVRDGVVSRGKKTRRSASMAYTKLRFGRAWHYIWNHFRST